MIPLVGDPSPTFPHPPSATTQVITLSLLFDSLGFFAASASSPSPPSTAAAVEPLAVAAAEADVHPPSSDDLPSSDSELKPPSIAAAVLFEVEDAVADAEELLEEFEEDVASAENNFGYK